jgi:hypothetical protein
MEWLVEEIKKLNPDDISPQDFFLVVPVEQLQNLRDGKITGLGTGSTLEPVARFFAKNSPLDGIEGVVLTWEYVFNTSLLQSKLKEDLCRYNVQVYLDSPVESIRYEGGGAGGGAGRGWVLEVRPKGSTQPLVVQSDCVVSCAGCWGKNFDLQAGVPRKKWNVSIREMVLIEVPPQPVTTKNSEDSFFRRHVPVVYFLDQTSSSSDRIAIIPDPASSRAKLYCGANEGYVEQWPDTQAIPTTTTLSPSLSLPLPKHSVQGSLLPLLPPNSWTKQISPEETKEAQRQLDRAIAAFPGLLGGSKVLGICYGTTVIVDSKDAMSRTFSPAEADGRGYFSVILPKAVYAVTLGREVADTVGQRLNETRAKL